MLALVVFVLLSWLLSILFFTYPRNLSRHESALLFLVVLIVNISATWIIDMELKYISLSSRVPEYVAFLLHRSLLVPLIPVMFTNWLLFARRPFVKGLLLVTYGMVFFCIEKLCLIFLVFKFEKWQMWESLVGFYLYLLLAVYLLRGYRKIFASEVNAQ